MSSSESVSKHKYKAKKVESSDFDTESESESESDIEVDVLGINGLVRKNNTCYLNSLLQIMTHIPCIVSYFKKQFKKNLIVDEESSLSELLHKLIDVQFNNTNSKITPSTIIKWLKNNTYFNVHEQQDCHEVLMIILDKLHQELKYKLVFKTDITDIRLKNGFKYLNEEYSYIYEQFYGMYNIDDKTCEPNSNLILDIPETNNSNESITLEDCISASKISINVYPNILIIMLKRYQEVNGKIIKRLTKVLYSESLIFESKTYQLEGVIIHNGSRITDGHYTAISKHYDSYYKFNDKQCYKVKSSFDKNAYMLFYSLVN